MTGTYGGAGSASSVAGVLKHATLPASLTGLPYVSVMALTSVSVGGLTDVSSEGVDQQ